MNGTHRRHNGQHRLGWLPLLCLQGIFHLLPEALGQPLYLQHQAQFSLPHLSHQEHLHHHLQLLTLDLPHLGYLHHQQHCCHHLCLQRPQRHLPPPITQLPVQQDLCEVAHHQLPCSDCQLHPLPTFHHQERSPLPASAFPPQHLPRVCVHRLASWWRTMRPSSMHHHHNDLMTTTPLSDLKSQGHRFIPNPTTS